jgi:dTDP-4-dehydrorhamnose reductase
LEKKVLVLGSTGLIGHQVYNFLNDNSDFHLSNIAYREKLQEDTILIDARKEDLFFSKIERISPNYIINCIGALIPQSKKNPESAIFLNAYLPHRISDVADKLNAKLIHMSTDCVFSGDKKTPYVELDEKDGQDTYARTKSAGEIINKRHLTLRTSVVGPGLKPDGKELFNWFMSQTGNIPGFTKAIWSGVTTLEIAKAVKWSIDNDITGLYHVTNNQPISKHDLLNLFKKYTHKEIIITPIENYDSIDTWELSDYEIEVDKSFIDTRKLIDYKVSSYEVMIYEMVESIKNNSSLYLHYKFGDSVEK